MVEKNVGPDHPDVATSLNNLAELYRIQGQYTQAELLSVEVIPGGPKLLFMPSRRVGFGTQRPFVTC